MTKFNLSNLKNLISIISGKLKKYSTVFLLDLNRLYNALFGLALGFNLIGGYEISNIILPLQPQ